MLHVSGQSISNGQQRRLKGRSDSRSDGVKRGGKKGSDGKVNEGIQYSKQRSPLLPLLPFPCHIIPDVM